MRVFGLFLCIIGVLIAAGGIIAYFSDSEGAGIAGMVVGGCFLEIGVMMFLTDFILRLFRRSAKLTIHFQFFKMRLLIEGEMGSPEGEGGWPEEGIGEIGEPRLSRWAE
ncbi:MAG: hypothetical protein V3V80_02595 [Dehalococcoidia bacterium]